MHHSLMVIDDFYPKPEAVRDVALRAPYETITGTTNWPGANSIGMLWTPEYDQFMSQIVGHKVRPTPNSSNGCFRLSPAGAKAALHIHFDPDPTILWAGVVYLSLPEDCLDRGRTREGTTFWRHKASGVDRCPATREEAQAMGINSEEDMHAFLKGDGMNQDRWEKLLAIPLKYNRLVLFRPWLWHSVGETFGDMADRAHVRLIQLVFLSAGDQGAR